MLVWGSHLEIPLDYPEQLGDIPQCRASQERGIQLGEQGSLSGLRQVALPGSEVWAPGQRMLKLPQNCTHLTH